MNKLVPVYRRRADFVCHRNLMTPMAIVMRITISSRRWTKIVVSHIEEYTHATSFCVVFSRKLSFVGTVVWSSVLRFVCLFQFCFVVNSFLYRLWQMKKTEKQQKYKNKQREAHTMLNNKKLLRVKWDRERERNWRYEKKNENFQLPVLLNYFQCSSYPIVILVVNTRHTLWRFAIFATQNFCYKMMFLYSFSARLCFLFIFG